MECATVCYLVSCEPCPANPNTAVLLSHVDNSTAACVLLSKAFYRTQPHTHCDCTKKPWERWDNLSCSLTRAEEVVVKRTVKVGEKRKDKGKKERGRMERNAEKERSGQSQRKKQETLSFCHLIIQWWSLIVVCACEREVCVCAYVSTSV